LYKLSGGSIPTPLSFYYSNGLKYADGLSLHMSCFSSIHHGLSCILYTICQMSAGMF
jgi:hypothetical protein